MANQKKNFVDNMVDVFGYDYVIGHCLCSSYDLANKASKETDRDKAKRLYNASRKYNDKAEQLTRERINNGL